MITIIDYGVGNIQAFVNIYKKLNIPVQIANTCDSLSRASKIILPGVGSFDSAMTKLEASGMGPTLNFLVLEKKCPVLGVCVGMQMMAKSSEEGSMPGLGWFEASVKSFYNTRSNSNIQLPHMGWNDVIVSESKIFSGIHNPLFYFLHSYYFYSADQSNTIGWTDYGGLFVSAVSCNNIYGVQFHPEKSHSNGIQLLKNFARI